MVIVSGNFSPVIKLFEGYVIHSSINKYREVRSSFVKRIPEVAERYRGLLKREEVPGYEGLIKESRELRRILKNITTNVNIQAKCLKNKTVLILVVLYSKYENKI